MSIEFKKLVETGCVVEYNGKFWGKKYDDDENEESGWVNIKKADLSIRGALKKPEDLTYVHSIYFNELQKGRIINIRRTTSCEIIS